MKITRMNTLPNAPDITRLAIAIQVELLWRSIPSKEKIVRQIFVNCYYSFVDRLAAEKIMRAYVRVPQPVLSTMLRRFINLEMLGAKEETFGR